ncbi:MAG: hypothetical protein JO174_05315 [Herbaspirillum sp.]|nr:hypothetical protein [Herbaspirillum sp.]
MFQPHRKRSAQARIWKPRRRRHHILASERAVADRLLARGIELQDAYELHDKLYAHPPALPVFLGLV